MKQSTTSLASVRRIAKEIIDFKDTRRKQILKTFNSEMKCKIVEEMVNIRLQRLRSPDGSIGPGKVSER